MDVEPEGAGDPGDRADWGGEDAGADSDGDGEDADDEPDEGGDPCQVPGCAVRLKPGAPRREYVPVLGESV